MLALNYRSCRAAEAMVVAIVDDNERLRVALGRLLKAAGYEIALFESAEAYLAAPPGEVGCFLLDVHLPGMSGVDLLRHLRPRTLLPIILMTADQSLAGCAAELGCDELLLKSTVGDRMLSTIASLVSRPA